MTDDLAAAPRSIRVLLVEDDADVRAALAYALENGTFDVTPVGGPQEAIDTFVARQGRFDIVVSDIRMPEMNGEELILELRERNPKLCALLLSGDVSEIVARRHGLSRGVAFLQKPVKPAELIEVIERLVGEE
jgi:CheY-like chemotaxis protein